MIYNGIFTCYFNSILFNIYAYTLGSAEKAGADSEYAASASEVDVVESYSDDGAVQIITDSATIYIPMSDIVDFAAERERLNGELIPQSAEISYKEKTVVFAEISQWEAS